MAIGLEVKHNYYTIGHSSLLNAFFDTVFYHLGDGEWGGVYPLLFNNLYNGGLDWKDAPELIENLVEIKGKLSNFRPNQLIWDIQDLSKRPPWKDNISADITSLSNYFITSNGYNLIDVMIEALKKSYELKSDVIIK